MSPLSAPPTSPKQEVTEIDFSLRLPLLVLFISAAIWLVIASVFGLIASLKFHSPNLLADTSWLTYGRVRPSYQDSFLYGFCLEAGLGVALWLLAHLGRIRLVQPSLVTAGAAFWNLGVTVGVLGILAGDATGFENLEMPGYAAPFIVLGYLLIGLFAVLTFHQRRERPLSPPHWFLFTAMFWFLWVYSTAELLLVAFPVRGVTQAIIAWWYSNNLTVVWLGLVGLAAVFYFLPRLTKRELDSHYVALFFYWLFILLASWGGIPNSAPVPAWMPILSTVTTVLTLLPLLALGIILRQALGRTTLLTNAAGHASLQFIRFGVVAFLCSGLMRILDSLASVSQVTNLTWFIVATQHLQCYGFFSMVIFGALYQIVPQIMGTPFPSTKLIRAHFWLAALGVLFTVVPLALGGIWEGFRLQRPEIAFVDVFKSTLHFLRVGTLGDLLIAAGHLAFMVNLCWLVNEFYRIRAEAAYAALTADLFKAEGAKS
jgi:cytochrome c oxidase cbb3-type subunit 1